MSGPSLYALTGNVLELDRVLASLEDGDADGEQAVLDTLEGITGEFSEKVEAVVMFARNLEATADAIKAARDKQAAREKALRARADYLLEYVHKSMTAAKLRLVEGAMLRVAIRKNPARLVVENESIIPRGFFVLPPPLPEPVPVLDKAALKTHLAAGFAVDGARMEQTERLDIK